MTDKIKDIIDTLKTIKAGRRNSIPGDIDVVELDLLLDCTTFSNSPQYLQEILYCGENYQRWNDILFTETYKYRVTNTECFKLLAHSGFADRPKVRHIYHCLKLANKGRRLTADGEVPETLRQLDRDGNPNIVSNKKFNKQDYENQVARIRILVNTVKKAKVLNKVLSKEHHLFRLFPELLPAQLPVPNKTYLGFIDKNHFDMTILATADDFLQQAKNDNQKSFFNSVIQLLENAGATRHDENKHNNRK